MKKLNFLMACALNLSLCYSAYAYEKRDDAEVVVERGASEYNPQGMHVGAFTLFPVLSIDTEYNTNIFKTDDDGPLGETDSFIAHFKPGFFLNSDWSRHALNLSLNTDITEYSYRPDDNNYEDIFLRLDGRLDITRDSIFDAAFSFNDVHEDRGSPDQRGGKTPTFYDEKRLDLNYSHQFNRYSVKPGFTFSRFDYENTPTSLGPSLKQSTRSRWEYTPSIRFGYEIQPEYEAYAKFIWRELDYDDDVVSGASTVGFDRNSDGYNALVGMAFDLTELITGDMSIGYLSRDYDDNQLFSIHEVNGFINLYWRPTALTSVLFNFTRDVYETTQLGVSGMLISSVGLNVEHELLRNVLLSAGVNYSFNEYKGYDRSATNTNNRKNREEDIYGATIGATYMLNRNFNMGLDYTYGSRDVNYALTDYEVHQVMLSLTAQY